MEATILKIIGGILIVIPLIAMFAWLWHMIGSLFIAVVAAVILGAGLVVVGIGLFLYAEIDEEEEKKKNDDNK